MPVSKNARSSGQKASARGREDSVEPENLIPAFPASGRTPTTITASGRIIKKRNFFHNIKGWIPRGGAAILDESPLDTIGEGSHEGSGGSTPPASSPENDHENQTREDAAAATKKRGINLSAAHKCVSRHCRFKWIILTDALPSACSLAIAQHLLLHYRDNIVGKKSTETEASLCADMFLKLHACSYTSLFLPSPATARFPLQGDTREVVRAPSTAVPARPYGFCQDPCQGVAGDARLVEADERAQDGTGDCTVAKELHAGDPRPPRQAHGTDGQGTSSLCSFDLSRI